MISLVEVPISTPIPGIGANETWRFYYYAGSQRIAVRVKSSNPNLDQLYYLFSDHLGSLNQTADTNGTITGGLRYFPFGSLRGSGGAQQTALTFTGQRSDPTVGLFWIGSRWYDGALGRWVQPDTIVPLESQGVQAWDRYAYVNNAPVVHDDPSGYCLNDDGECIDLLISIQKVFDIDIDDHNGLWTPESLSAVKSGMEVLQSSIGKEDFTHRFAGVIFNVEESDLNYMWTTGNRDIVIPSEVLDSSDYIEQETVHELLHIWDNSCSNCMSEEMATITGSKYDGNGDYHPGGQVPTRHALKSAGEDWAESGVASLFPGYAQFDWSTDRINYTGQVLQPSQNQSYRLRYVQ